MTELDIFGRVEEKIAGFVARHKWAVRIIVFPIVLITFTALIFVLLAGQIGYSLMLSMLQTANSGAADIVIPVSNMEATDEIIEVWRTIIHPAATFLFYWVYAITLLIPITYIGGAIYLVWRYAYRRSKEI
jgi:hypothetical protein